MEKKSWPWIGSTEMEMGSGNQLEEYKKVDSGSHAPSDGLSPEKSLVETREPSMHYEGGIISPVEGVSLADDGDSDKVSVDILNEEGEIASFSCDVAKDTSQKVVGLQSYSALQSTAGLLFPYRRDEDVIYHMGTVSFPIDILFVGGDNSIKRIYSNINPGTLATFGCSGVKNVLEICGGLSDRLGIKVGNKIKISGGKTSDLESIRNLNKFAKNMGIRKNIVVSYSDRGKSSIQNWKGFPVYTIGSSFGKTASKSNLISELMKISADTCMVDLHIFDFDGLIERSPEVKIFKNSSGTSKTVRVLQKIGGIDVSVDLDSFRVENSAKGIKINNEESIVISGGRSLNSFINDDDLDFSKMCEKIRKISRGRKNKIIMATRMPNPEVIKCLVLERIFQKIGVRIDVDLIRLSKNDDYEDLSDKINSIYKFNSAKIYSDSSIIKRSGSPVPNDVKDKAKRAYKLLESASDDADTSLENMNKNLAAYSKIQGDTESIKNSKGQYNQSVKSNTRVVKSFLIKIRDAIKIFNEVKDISTTYEVIDGLATSAKHASTFIEEIFDLINEIETPDFFTMLSSKVFEYDNIINDLQSTIKRAMSYINSDILGLIVLSD